MKMKKSGFITRSLEAIGSNGSIANQLPLGDHADLGNEDLAAHIVAVAFIGRHRLREVVLNPPLKPPFQ